MFGIIKTVSVCMFGIIKSGGGGGGIIKTVCVSEFILRQSTAYKHVLFTCTVIWDTMVTNRGDMTLRIAGS
jgi:hypothetical protein